MIVPESLKPLKFSLKGLVNAVYCPENAQCSYARSAFD